MTIRTDRTAKTVRIRTAKTDRTSRIKTVKTIRTFVRDHLNGLKVLSS